MTQDPTLHQGLSPVQPGKFQMVDGADASAKSPVFTLLSMDMGLEDCYYRLRRDLQCTSSVVYVYLKDLDILPEDRRTYGPSIVTELQTKVPIWNEDWTTLTVFSAYGEVQYARDDWDPHSLSLDVPLQSVPRLDVLDLHIQHSLKDRVFIVHHNSEKLILKTCPFEYQLRYLDREIRAYTWLFSRSCKLVPKILAYVFERNENQIIGFVSEKVQGHFATLDDYENCESALRSLHSYDFLHGDINRFNIIITTDGPRFIDLEKSRIKASTEHSESDFLRLQQQELDGLKDALNDKEEWGKPWLVVDL